MSVLKNYAYVTFGLFAACFFIFALFQPQIRPLTTIELVICLTGFGTIISYNLARIEKLNEKPKKVKK